MLSGTARGQLLLLHGSLAVALDMDAFPRRTLLTLGAVPIFMALLATHKTLVVVATTVLVCFPGRTSCSLAWVVLVGSTSLRLGPRISHRPSVMPFCCLETLVSIDGLNYS